MSTTVEALIVSYNTKRELEVTLRTLLDHAPGGDVELRVVVLDNASRDGSPEMVRELFPTVGLVQSPQNLGFGIANNQLAERSSADYLLLLNSDVVVSEDIVTPLLEALEAHPVAIAAGPRLRGADGRVQNSAHRLPTLAYEFATVLRGKRLGKLLKPLFDSQQIVNQIDGVGLLEHDASREPEFLWATCWLLRRSDVQGGNLFDPSFPMYDEDLDFCRRAARRGRTFIYVGRSELVHLGGASSISSLDKLRLTRTARRHYYSVHASRATALAYAVLVPAVARLAFMLQRIPEPGWLRVARGKM